MYIHDLGLCGYLQNPFTLSLKYVSAWLGEQVYMCTKACGTNIQTYVQNICVNICGQIYVQIYVKNICATICVNILANVCTNPYSIIRMGKSNPFTLHVSLVMGK